MSIEQVDVVIVGSRCAGTAAAVPLVRAGHKVVVLDKARFPADTLSTHVLVPNGVAELKKMGALDRILALNPARSTHLRITDGDMVVCERYRPFDGIDYGICVPRNLQDECLVDTAREAGADVREKCSVENVVWRGGRAVGVVYKDPDGEEREIHARLVIGADGRKSRVAAEVDAWTPYRGSKNGRGFAFRYMDDPKAGTFEHHEMGVYRAERTVALTLPSTPEGRVLVVWMCPAEDVSAFRKDTEAAWQQKLDDDPVIAGRLEGATNMGKVRSTADLSSYYRRSSGPGWALAGDAGHFKDPVTGNGMRDALKHGRLLGEAATATLHDPEQLDAALARWERGRDLDTLSTYHWGNRESRPEPTSDLVREVLRTFAGKDGPDLSDTFNRARPIEAIVSPTHLVRGLVAALRRPGADRSKILKQALGELPLEWHSRRHRLIDGFRSTRPTKTERPDWTVGTAPGPPSHRPAGDPAPLRRTSEPPVALP
jgi:2-polyprenyl-6-methoxyphenol hydroxylase-like FAD-dependent oxidoreductase